METSISTLKKLSKRENVRKTGLLLMIIVVGYSIMALMMYLFRRVYNYNLDETIVNQVSTYIVFTVPIFAILCVQKISRDRLILVRGYRNVIVKVLLIPFFIGIVLNYLIGIARYAPRFFNIDAIDVAKGQGVLTFKPTFLMDLFFRSALPAFNEEVLIKYSLIILLISYSLSMIDFKYFHAKKVGPDSNPVIRWLYKAFCWTSKLLYWSLYKRTHRKGCLNRYKLTEALVITVLSFIFAMMHNPSPANFMMYFIPGVAYTILILRYGLVAGITAHMSYNYFSHECNIIACDTVNYLIRMLG